MERFMFSSIGASVYGSLSATSCRCRPWQVAAAVALGVTGGLLLTKSPLGAIALGVLFFLPVHLPLAIFVSLLTAGLVWMIEPALGQFGWWSLNFGGVASAVGYLNTIPFVPWLRLNNTVVHGALMLGLVQTIPTFMIVRRVFIALTENLVYETEDAEWIRVDAAHENEFSPRVARDSQRSSVFADEGLELEPLMQNEQYTDAYDDESGSKYEQYEIPDTPIAGKLETGTSDVAEESSAAQEEMAANNLVADSTSEQADIAAEQVISPGGEDASLDAAPASEATEADQEAVATELAEVHFSAAQQATDESAGDEAIERVETTLQSRGDINELNTEDVAARAAELAGLVDEMLSAIKTEEVKSATETETNADSQNGSRESSEELTNSELPGARYLADQQTSREEAPTPHIVSRATSESSEGGETTTVVVKKETASLVEEVAQHEEALRYLLRHLKEIKERT